MSELVRSIQRVSEKKHFQSIGIHLLIEHRVGTCFLTSKYEAIQVLDLQEEARELDAQCKVRLCGIWTAQLWKATKATILQHVAVLVETFHNL